MPGQWFTETRPRRLRRGAALSLVFAGVLATGAATGAFGGETAPRRPAADARNADSRTAPGPSGTAPQGGTGRVPEPERGRDAAHELVSRSGDRWSAAYSAREYEGLRQALDGSYVGVGISVREVRAAARRGGDGKHTGGDGKNGAGHGGRPPRAVEVDHVEPGSPAARAGVRAGDRLRAVGDRPVTGMPVTDVVALLRGTPGADGPGSSVTLELSRNGPSGAEGSWHTTLRRARLDTDAVTVDRLGPGVTRIKVAAFTRGAGEQVREAVAERVPEGSGVLLDLRGNAGGLVDEAVTAASAFLDGGLVATYDDEGTQRALYAPRGKGDDELPVVVLVDGGTMSAAELLTGALQDRGRAVVVGSHTFGKGSVQMPRRQRDGSVAELTVGHYATPSGRDVEGRGIAPDLSVDSRDGATERARTVLSGLEPPS